jgi:hypothetical protein
MQARLQINSTIESSKVLSRHLPSHEMLVRRLIQISQHLKTNLALTILFVGLCHMVQAQDYDLTAPGSETPAPPPNGCIALLQNVLIFDGRSTALSAPSSVLVRGNIIERVAANPISVDADSDATVVKGNSRVLMPGLIGADNRELMGITGFINPYPGRLGVVQEGAFADLLLVDGNPLENIKSIEDPGKNFLVIMKDGKIYKNTVPR